MKTVMRRMCIPTLERNSKPWKSPVRRNSEFSNFNFSRFCPQICDFWSSPTWIRKKFWSRLKLWIGNGATWQQGNSCGPTWASFSRTTSWLPLKDCASAKWSPAEGHAAQSLSQKTVSQGKLSQCAQLTWQPAMAVWTTDFRPLFCVKLRRVIIWTTRM